MDHDAPEPEQLNLEENITIIRVQAILLHRSVTKACAAMDRFVTSLQNSLPPDDWDTLPGSASINP